MSEPPKILYCHCCYAQVLPADVKAAVLGALAESGEAFTAAPDLCEMSARRDPRLKEFAGCGALKIAACHPRAVQWLFHAAGAPLPEDVEVVNLRELKAEEASARLLSGELAPTAS